MMNPVTNAMMKPALRLLAAVSLAAILAPSDSAGARPGYHKPSSGYVTAQSRYGNGSVSGRVEIRKGVPHVQLPSGWWEDCAGNCRETLRRQHLDFWETIDEEAPLGGKD